jgi:hypothetical protein
MSQSAMGSLKNEGIDRMGALASSLCAIHCAACALLPTAFGALGVDFLLGHKSEWLFTLIAIAFAVGALVMSWRQHRSRAIALLLIVGIAGLFASRGIEMTSGHAHSDHHQEHHEAPSALVDHDGEDATGDSHHTDGKHHEEDEHGDSAHLAGTAVGVFAGMFLFSGHLLNLRALRRRRCFEECE